MQATLAEPEIVPRKGKPVSVIRSVYRFDDGFSQVKVEKDFQHFVEAKFK
jgi:hypothetical protein